MSDPSGKTTIVVGASRGLGLGIATALAAAGAAVVAVSRTVGALPESANEGGSIRSEIAAAAPGPWPAGAGRVATTGVCDLAAVAA